MNTPEKYAHTAQEVAQRLAQHKKQRNVLSWARVFSFFSIIGFSVLGGQFHPALAGLGFFAGLWIFIFFVGKSAKKKAEIHYAKAQQEVLAQEKKAWEEKAPHNDAGEDFQNALHPYANDLDLFAEGGLFQHLSRCQTPPGRKALAHALKEGESAPILAERQSNVAVLARDFSAWFALRSYASLLPAQEKAWDTLAQGFDFEPILKQEKAWRVGLWGLSALTLAALAWALFGGLTWPFLVAFLAQLALAGRFGKKTAALQERFAEQEVLLRAFEGLLPALSAVEFATPSGKKLREQAQAAEKSGPEKLAHLLRLLDYRLNNMAWLTLNGLFAWDLQLLLRLQKWQAQGGAEALKALPQLTAELEFLLSLAAWQRNRPDFIIPVFETEKKEFFFECEEIGHPLLSKTERKTNALTLQPPGLLMLITGANMAGKSTFLRSLGINWALARAGAVVCATSWQFTPTPLYTSMRNNDSLLGSTSAFFAELKRLAACVEILRKGEPLFVLLDEVLKGTNSEDQHAGARGLVQRLVELGAAGAVTTHDLQLTALEAEHGGRVLNYAFEVEVQEDRLHFDYQLRRGPCQSRNAVFLMEQLDIL